MTIDVRLPAARGPTGPSHRAACRLAVLELFRPVGTTGPRGERQVIQTEQICKPWDLCALCRLADIRAMATGIWGEDERSALARTPRRLAAAARSGRVRNTPPHSDEGKTRRTSGANGASDGPLRSGQRCPCVQSTPGRDGGRP